MEKSTFIYKKEDGSTSERTILNPVFLKESSNSIKSFDKPEVKYLQGFEIKKEGLSEEEIEKYKDVLEDYIDWTKPSITEFFTEKGLDPKKIQQKTFKKEGITELKILED